MEAPVYLPAQAYERPVVVAYQMTTANTSIASLLAIPEAKAILIREIPGFEKRIATPMLTPHLGNFSARSLVQWGLFKAAELDHVDAQLRTISGGPAR